MPGQFVTAALYSLLNDRMMAVKPMVISTNLNVDELSRRYSPRSRPGSHGDFQRLTFVGNDIPGTEKQRFMMKTGILFDLDGTLLDTLADLADSVNHVLASFGYPQRTVEEVRQFVGNGAARLIAQAVPEVRTPPRCLRRSSPITAPTARSKPSPYEGIPEGWPRSGSATPRHCFQQAGRGGQNPLRRHFPRHLRPWGKP